MPEHDNQNAYMRQLMDMQYELYAYIVSLTGGSSDADDVLQEANLRIMELVSGKTPPVIDNFRAWARKVAFFHVLTWRKSRQRERLLFDSVLLEEVAAQLEVRESATDKRMIALEDCLKKLPETLRVMTEERYKIGGAVKRIAEKWHTTPHAITMNLYRVRLMLKDCVEKTLSEGALYG